MNQQNAKGVSPIFLIGVMLMIVFLILSYIKDPSEDYTKAQFIKDIEAGLVTDVTIQPNPESPTGYLSIERTTGDKRLYVTDVAEAEALVRGYGYDPQVNDVKRDEWGLKTLIPMLIVLIVGFFLFTMINAQHNAAANGGNKMMNFGRSRARITVGDGKKINFGIVAGLQEEKEELREIVEFLQKPEMYTKVGARIPKGVLLEGPPAAHP